MSTWFSERLCLKVLQHKVIGKYTCYAPLSSVCMQAGMNNHIIVASQTHKKNEEEKNAPLVHLCSFLEMFLLICDIYSLTLNSPPVTLWFTNDDIYWTHDFSPKDMSGPSCMSQVVAQYLKTLNSKDISQMNEDLKKLPQVDHEESFLTSNLNLGGKKLLFLFPSTGNTSFQQNFPSSACLWCLEELPKNKDFQPCWILLEL